MSKLWQGAYEMPKYHVDLVGDGETIEFDLGATCRNGRIVDVMELADSKQGGVYPVCHLPLAFADISPDGKRVYIIPPPAHGARFRVEYVGDVDDEH